MTSFNPVSPSSRPGSSDSRSSSIVRSCRDSFVSELEYLPPDNVEIKPFEYVEEVVDAICEGDDNMDVSCSMTEQSAQENDREKVHQIDMGIEDTKKGNEVVEEIDPKIKKGLKKIEKLDKVLAEQMEKEREVKKERRALEKEFQLQVQNLLKEKGMEKVCGSHQLLSLCASTDRIEDDAIERKLESIFATQIHSDFYHEEIKSTEKFEKLSRNGNDEEDSSDKQNKKKNKDFIKRNIQLASQANEVIQLTEAERKRLDELLSNDNDLLLVDNPFTVPSISVSGFQFSDEERSSLANIDARLKDLLSEEDYILAILGEQLSPREDSSVLSESFKSEVTLPNDLCDNNEANCGEKVLQNEHEQRSMSSRLNDIEARLKKLQLTEVENEPNIDPDLLRRLLDVDSRLTSSSTSICDSFRSGSTLMHDIDISSVDSQSITALDTKRTFVTTM